MFIRCKICIFKILIEGKTNKRRNLERIRLLFDFSQGRPKEIQVLNRIITYLIAAGAIPLKINISGRYSKCMVSNISHLPPQTNPNDSNALITASGG